MTVKHKICYIYLLFEWIFCCCCRRFCRMASVASYTMHWIWDTRQLNGAFDWLTGEIGYSNHMQALAQTHTHTRAERHVTCGAARRSNAAAKYDSHQFHRMLCTRTRRRFVSALFRSVDGEYESRRICDTTTMCTYLFLLLFCCWERLCALCNAHSAIFVMWKRTEYIRKWNI